MSGLRVKLYAGWGLVLNPSRTATVYHASTSLTRRGVCKRFPILERYFNTTVHCSNMCC